MLYLSAQVKITLILPETICVGGDVGANLPNSHHEYDAADVLTALGAENSTSNRGPDDWVF